MSIISRSEAKGLGLKRYFTGASCAQGHIAERYVSGRQCVACTLERDKLPRNRQRNKELRRARKYGVDAEEYAARLANQGYGCAICSTQLSNDKQQHLDHDHETGRTRGILCHACNVGLGHFKDSTELLKRALQYLERTE